MHGLQKARSFEAVTTALMETSLVEKRKLQYLLSVGKQLKSFLVKHQTDASMVTSLCTDLSELIKLLLSRTVKSDS